jgi:hypothetical protein
VTSAGTWTFGTATDAYGDQIELNGGSAGNGYSQELEVANQGQMYAESGGQWWEWTGSGWGGTGNPNQITTTAVTLDVAENAAATPIGIAAPVDANYTANQLSVTVKSLPSDGTVYLSDGATPVTAGESLSVAQLTGLEFQPTANLASGSSSFTYTVSDPAGLSVGGSATLAISGGSPTLSPDGSILTAGEGGDLVTSAGTWTFGTATDAYGDQIELNGGSAGNGYSQELEVANQGQMYAESGGQWWEWTGSGWVGTSNPTNGSLSSDDSLHSNSSIQFSDVTLAKNLTQYTAYGSSNDTSAAAQFDNAQIWGLPAGNVTSGPNVQTNDVFLTTHPWTTS